MIWLCSKSYFAEGFDAEEDHGEIKFSVKGVNRGQFKIKKPMLHNEHVLTLMENLSTPRIKKRQPTRTIRVP